MAGTSWQGAAISAQMGRAASGGLNQAAEFLLGKSVPRAPVDTSNLRGSAAVTPSSPTDLVSAVSYNAAPYDVIQHEALDNQHESGGPKYLEGPFVENAEAMTAIIARAMAAGST